MADVIVVGGGMCGLATAMMLGRDGHDVTVIERDGSDVPDSLDAAIEAWERPGVSQFRLAHYMHARFRHILEAELPDVVDDLDACGATRFDIVRALMPKTLPDRSMRDSDSRYTALTGRRPMLEYVFANAAEKASNVTVVRGAKVNELVTGSSALSGVPHVVGVRTDDGSEYCGDIVVDATGRASKLPARIEAAGGRAPYEEGADCGFIYYGYTFRADSLPEADGVGLWPFPSFSTLTLPGDNNTWMVVLFISSRDTELKELRHPDKWFKLVRDLPIAGWADAEVLGDMQIMSGLMDRYRRFVVDDKPVVTGLLPVADAWASTNPSLGRGISLGLWHGQLLRDHIRKANDDPVEFAMRWDEITETNLTPWYQAQIAMDRARIAELDADREGRPVPEPAADDVQAQMTNAFLTAMNYDPDVYRGFAEIMGCLKTPEEVFSEPGMFEKVLAAADGKQAPSRGGPDRAQTLALLA